MTITLRDLSKNVTFSENDVNAGPQFIDTDVTVTATQSLAGGRLTWSYASPDHRYYRFIVVNEGTGAGQIGLSGPNGTTYSAGSTITYEGVAIGTQTGQFGSSITVVFNENVTAKAVEALIERIALTSSLDTIPLINGFTLNITDAAGRGLLGERPTFDSIQNVPFAWPVIDGGGTGINAAPAFADLDADGDLDMIVGTQGAALQFWQNTGTFSYQIPVFTQLTGAANPFNGIGGGLQRTPTFIDLDGDGDLDLVAGSGSGKISAWKNTGSPTSPAFTALTGSANPFNDIPFGYVDDNTAPLYRSTPTFVDFDGDGDLDLVSGEQFGTLLAWRNTGTASAPVFTALTGGASPFNGIDVGYFSAPTFTDLDGDGDQDMLVGNMAGQFLYYQNTGTATAPSYTAVVNSQSFFYLRAIESLNSKPVFADINGDEKPDMVIAGGNGKLYYLYNTTLAPSFTVTVIADNDVPVISTPDPNPTRREGADLLAFNSVATDPDGTPIVFTWSLAGTDSGLFTIDSATGKVSFKTAPNFEAPADANGDNVYEIVLQASDGTGIGERAISYTIYDQNDAPVITSVGAVNFAENATGAVYTPTATDEDPGTVLTWTLSGADAALFNINASTGVVTFKPVAVNPSLAVITYKTVPDFEKPTDAGANNVYNISVTASDGPASGGGLTITKAVAITVTNVNEAPKVLAGRIDFVEGTSGPAYIGSAIDPDAGTVLTWTLGGTDQALFDIDGATGVVTFKALPNFEAPADAGGDNVYDLTVTASDGALSDTRALTIEVTDTQDLFLSGLTSAITLGENAVNAAPRLLDADVTFTASDPLAGARLVVTGLLAEDRLSILDQGDAAGQVGVAGGTISYGGVAIGTATGGSGNTFTVTFNGDATAAAVDAVIERLAYANVSDMPTATRSLVVDVLNAAGEGMTASLPQYSQMAVNPFAAYNAQPGVASPVAAFLDVNGDGLQDYVVMYDPVQTWINTGTASAPAYTLLSNAANPFSYRFVGQGAAYDLNGPLEGLRQTPKFTSVDLDNDGDTDLVGGDQWGGLFAWRNTGTAAAPVFTPMTGADDPFVNSGRINDLAGLQEFAPNANPALFGTTFSKVGAYFWQGTTPSFADVTGDGLVDLIATGYDQALDAPGLRVWRNTGTAAAPVFNTQLTGTDNPFSSFDFRDSRGTAFTPSFVDLEGDGDLDFVMGTDAGKLRSFINTGTNTAPVYAELIGAANPFNGIDVGRAAHPAFVDLNGDGHLDLVVGEDSSSGIFVNGKFVHISYDDTAPNGYVIDPDYGMTAFLNVPKAARPSITVTVTAEDDAPRFTSGATASLAENATGTVYSAAAFDPEGDAFTLSLGGADAALFNFDATTGEVSFKAAPDFETRADANGDNVYEVVVNGTGAGPTGSKAVSITVTNVNEAPAVSSAATANFTENGIGTAYAAAAIDPDAGTILTWTLSGTDAGLFDIDAATGAVTFKVSPNFEAPTDDGNDNVYDLIVTASDGVLSDSKSVAITVTDLNEAPAVTSGGTADFAENAVGTAYAATATDADGNSITWALGGTDAALFDIDAATGLVTFKTAPDRELPGDAGADSVYDILVIASDGALSTPKAVAITVTNVNETPSVTSSATASFGENGTGTAYAASASDPDAGTTLTWTLSGTDAALFDINGATGAVTFKASPNFEAPTDNGGNNIYDIIVTASDGTLSDSKAVAITVTDVNDAPVVISGRTISVAENVVIPIYTAIATDADANSVSWSLAGADAARFAINATTGVVRFLASPDFEAPSDQGTNNVYDLIVTASDGSLTGSRAVTITVLNAIEGAAASDTLVGTVGADIIQGFGGKDSLNGGAGNDSLDGGTGDDTLNGGVGADILIGGVNDDTYMVDNVGDVVIEGVGEGSDRVVATVSYTLTANVERLTLSGAANLNGAGNELDNRIEGNSGANVLEGDAGNDSLFGGLGNDTLLGGLGIDAVDGGVGADSMAGGAGDDRYFVDNAGDVVVEAAGEGYDLVYSTVTYALTGNVERLILLGSDSIDGTGNALANRLDGNAAANRIDGGDGDDQIIGYEGNDSLLGGLGNDSLDGRTGADTMAGGAGDDRYQVDSADDLVVEAAGEGYDTVYTTASYTLTGHVERLILDGNAAIDGTGNALANVLYGNDAANTLDGADGDDQIVGYAGNDTLLGGMGADTLEGGAGADRMTGGAGGDRFLFRTTAEAVGDVITDFNVADADRIDLRAIDANTLLGGDQAFAWIGAVSFGGVAGQLRFAGGMLEGDADGNGIADFQISLTGVASLTAASIFL